MLLYLLSRIISATIAFIYPGYASYKTLSQRPASEADLERWLMYWSVLGCILGLEYLAEWTISWLPFYYPIKTAFLAYLALPQLRGSSYLYITHLQPFFHEHEHQIDAALAELKMAVYTFLQEKAKSLWEAVSASLRNQPPSTAAHSTSAGAGGAGSAAPPTLNNPASGPAQIVSGLWRSYGPSILASGASLLTSAVANAPSLPRGPQPQSTLFQQGAAPFARGGLFGDESSDLASGSGAGVTQSILERRRQLQAELAALPATPELRTAPLLPPESPVPNANASPSRSDSSASLRERVAGGRFEEVDPPSDAEGYDVAGTGSEAEEQGHEYNKPAPPRRTSWFWGGSQASSGGYDKVKSD